MTYDLKFKRTSIHSEKGKLECIKTSVNWKPSSSITTDDTVLGSHCVPVGTSGVQEQDMGIGVEWICEGHVWMPQPWKQGQVRLIPNNDKPTNHWWRMTHHTPQCTPQHALPHGCTVVERLNDHTVFGFTLCFHCNQTHQEHHCVDQQLDWCQHWWNTVPNKIQKKERIHGATWHTVLWMTRHGWDGCSAMASSPKPFHFFERLAQCPHLTAHINTMKMVELARTHRLWYMRLFFKTRGTGGWADVDKCWWPPHDTHFHTIHQSNPPSFTLFQPSLNTPWHEAIAR